MKVVTVEGTPILTLMDTVSGFYEIKTHSGTTYLLNLDDGWFRRLPRRKNAILTLRRDDQDVTLLEVLECTVGRRMHLLIDLQVPDVACTRRVTTPVLTIRKIEGLA